MWSYRAFGIGASLVSFASVVAASGFMGCLAAPTDSVASDSVDTLVSSAQVATGLTHSCAILNDGSVKCWGYNGQGQLGLGDYLDRGDGPNEMGANLPVVDLGTGKTAVRLAAGWTHTCALLNDASIKCWGSNYYGQLGLGYCPGLARNRGDGPNEMGNNLPAVDLGDGKTAVQIVANYNHTCAILNDGSVKCWGHNNQGQLGLGDRESRGDETGETGDGLPAVDLGTGNTAVQLAAGYSHTCAILNDASVKCWGVNAYGQLGIGDTQARGDGPGEMGDSLPAVDLGTGNTAVRLTLGSDHTCALLSDGSAKCWGYNYYGSLGTGDVQTRGNQPNEMGDNLPLIDLGIGSTAVQLVAGRYHTCAVLNDGSAKCWGFNNQGQLGLGDMQWRGNRPDQMGDNLPAVDLGAGETAVQLAPGQLHTCAVLNTSVKCWGFNDRGQLGLGDKQTRGDGPNEMGNNLPAVSLF